MDEQQRQVMDKAWNDLLKTFDQKDIKRSIKDAYRRVGKQIAAVARDSVKKSWIHNGSRLARGMRVRVYPRGGGFMITVKPHGRQGFYKNRRGEEKPVLMWAEEGTKQRTVRNGKDRRAVLLPQGFRVVGKGRGSMPAYHFLTDAEQQGPGIVEKEISKETEAATIRRAGKLGVL